MEKGFTRKGRRSRYGANLSHVSDESKPVPAELTNGGSEKEKSGDEVDDIKPDISSEDMFTPSDSAESVKDDLTDEKQNSSPSDTMEFHGFDAPSTPNAVTLVRQLVGKFEADLEDEESIWTQQDAEEMEPYHEAKLRGQDIYTDSEDENTKPSKDVRRIPVALKKRPLAQLTEEFNDDDKQGTPPNKRIRKKSIKAREAAGDTPNNKDDIPEVSSSADIALKGKGLKGESHREISSSGVQGSRLKQTTRPDDKNLLLFLKPFELGWKRELVFRSTEPKGGEGSKKYGDIYYYTPDGKKVRSRKEIEQYLTGTGLTIENFTFLKESLGLNDESKEVIRDAFMRKSIGTPIGRKKEKLPKLPKHKGSGKSSSTAESPNISEDMPASPSTGTTETSISPVASTSSSKNSVTPKVMLKHTKQSPKTATKMKATSPRKGMAESPKSKGNRVKKENTQSDDNDHEIGLTASIWEQGDAAERSPANSTSSSWKSRASTLTSPPQESCSISCAGAQGAPSLQCRVCLCLYHPECVGLQSSESTLCHTCKNGHSGPKEPVSGSNTMDPENASSAIPYLIQKTSGFSRAAVSTVHPRTGNQRLPLAQASMNSTSSLVGGLTTWLPPSSTVQVQPVPRPVPPVPPIASPACSETPTLPQTVANIGGQKFIVVPKHNVLSVSPAVSGHPSTHPVNNFHHPSPPGIYLVPYAAAGSECNSLPMYVNGASHSSDNTSSPSDRYEPKRGRPTDIPGSTGESPTSGSSKSQGQRNMDNFISDLSFGYVALFHVMGYLKVQELLRASRVCRMWRDLSLHPNLWRTVRMKNSQVTDWDGFAAALRARCTRVLDLRKMLAPGRPEDIDTMWTEFCRVIGQADSLQHIELSRCPSSVVEQLARSCTQLRVLNAVAIKSEEVDLEPLQNLRLLEELRLKSTNGMNITMTLDPLVSCNLRHLSLTSIKNLDSCNVNVLSELKNLESLELGDCMKLDSNFGSDHLVKLTNLQRLRLEKGQVPVCPIISIIEAVSKLPALEQLEIINFDVKPGFDKALAQCKQVRRLLIIPTYITTSASTNHIVLCSIPLLADSLEYLVWGLTQELTRVTDLFIDQCEQRKGPQGTPSKLNAFPGECIPIIKPVVEESKGENESSSGISETLSKETIKMEVDDEKINTEDKEERAEESAEKNQEKKSKEGEERTTDEKEESPDTDNVESLARGFRALSALQQNVDSTTANPGTPPVSILPIPKLHKLLVQLLPSTHVKILKVPFPSTWRQTFPELNSF